MTIYCKSHNASATMKANQELTNSMDYLVNLLGKNQQKGELL